MTTGQQTARRRGPRRNGRGAFTLVELLVVMFIMSVVAALIVGVSWYVIEQGRKTQTATNQKRLLEAVMAYRKVTGTVPQVNYSSTASNYDVSKPPFEYSDPSKEMAALCQILWGNDRPRTSSMGSAVDPANKNSEIYKATHPFLGEDNGSSLTTDAYGNSMIYLKDGGMGGGPVIISAGPDERTGYENGLDYVTWSKDNIRSDAN